MRKFFVVLFLIFGITLNLGLAFNQASGAVLPPGCTSTSGFSTTTGLSCSPLPPVVVVPTPQNLRFSDATSTSVVISWDAVSAVNSSDPKSGYYLLKQIGTSSWTQLGATMPMGYQSTSYLDASLSPDTQYSYKVIAYTSSAQSYASNSITFRTKIATRIPVCPTGYILDTTTNRCVLVPPITLLSPNGEESEPWQVDTYKGITWKYPASSSSTSQARFSITLKPANFGGGSYTPATNPPGGYYLLANTTTNGTSPFFYSWKVGRDSKGSLIPDGSYTVQVCLYGTNVCDKSDSSFKIVSPVPPTPTPVCPPPQVLDPKTNSCILPPPVASPFVEVISPNGGEVYKLGSPFTIKWRAVNTPEGAVAGIALVQEKNGYNFYYPVDAYCNKPGDSCLDIHAGSYTMLLSPSIPGLSAGLYKVRVFCSDRNSERGCGGLGAEDVSDSYFKVISAATLPPTNSSITVLSPNGGEIWMKGKEQTIEWESSITGPFDVHVIPSVPPCNSNVCIPPSPPYLIAKDVKSPFSWKVGETLFGVPPDGSYQVMICSQGTCDSSDSYFQIVSSVTPTPTPSCRAPQVYNPTTRTCVSPAAPSNYSITVLSPNGGESWSQGSSQKISWKTTGALSANSRVSVSLFNTNLPGSVNSPLFSKDVSAVSASSLNLVVPKELPASNYKAYVQLYDSPSPSGGGIFLAEDYSNNTFSVTPASVPAEDKAEPVALMPDLTVGPVTPTVVTSGSVQAYSATITNLGSKETGTTGKIYHLFQFRSSPIENASSRTVNRIVSKGHIGAGDTDTVSYRYTYNNSGDRYARVCADNSAAMIGRVTESNENNNCGPWTRIDVVDTSSQAGNVLGAFDGAEGMTIALADIDPEPQKPDTCLSFTNNLRYRDRDEYKNGEVSLLQDYLQVRGYLNSEPTGFFGILTRKAVMAFQKANGITPPSGYFGPITRAKLKELTCGGTTTEGKETRVFSSAGYLTALGPNTRMWGTHNLAIDTGIRCVQAPCPSSSISYPVKADNDRILEALRKYTNSNVTITGILAWNNLEGGFYGIKASNVTPVGVVIPSLKVLYPNGGETWAKGTSQTIKWQDDITSTCPEGAYCIQGFPSKNYDLKLFSYHTPCTGIICPAYVSSSYTIAKNIPGLSHTWSVGKASEGVVPDGSYTLQVCVSGTNTCDSSNSYLKITTTSSTTPVIYGVSGPQSLKQGETGTWAVRAYDASGGNLNYSVLWGDEVYVAADAGSRPVAVSPLPPQQTGTFTHVYSRSGKFNPVFTVANSAGKSAKASASVIVEEVKPSISLQVLYPNGRETWAKNTNQTIRWEDKRSIPTCPEGAYCAPPAPRYFNITLVRYSPPCTTNFCPLGGYVPYTIANNVYGRSSASYVWSVGKTVEGVDVPDGDYQIRICASEGAASFCDSSDSPFTITSWVTGSGGGGSVEPAVVR